MNLFFGTIVSASFIIALTLQLGYLAIAQEHDKLLTSLRTAYAKELSLDKKETSYDDLLDALRLSLKGYNITQHVSVT
jgi:hypothetical protein